MNTIARKNCSKNPLNRAVKVSCGLVLIALTPWLPPAKGVSVLVQHNDLARTGANTSETILSPANVNPGNFGLMFVDNVDGQVYAQPLYVANLGRWHIGRAHPS